MIRGAAPLRALCLCVIVASCGSTAHVGTSTIAPSSSSVGVVAAQTLSFTMPVSGFALNATDNAPGVRIFDADGHQVGVIEGAKPQQYYGSTTGVMVEREAGLRLARPGASQLVSVPWRRSSGLVVPGWIESGRCSTHPERPLLEICDKEITVRDGQGAVRGECRGAKCVRW